MGDVAECLRHQLLASVADDVAQPLIDLQPTAVRSDAGNTDGGVLEGGPESRTAIAQRLDLLLTLARAPYHEDHLLPTYLNLPSGANRPCWYLKLHIEQTLLYLPPDCRDAMG